MAGIPSGVLDRAGTRVEVQTLDIGQQYVIEQIAFVTKWRENSISTNSSAYARFTIPAGYYCALDSRMIKTDTDHIRYFVYPEGTFTISSEKTDDENSFSRERNLSQDADFIPDIIARVNVSAAPAATSFIVDDDVFGAVDVGGNSSGELSPDNTFLLLNPDQTFLLRLNNLGTNPAKVSVSLNFALIPISIIKAIRVRAS